MLSLQIIPYNIAIANGYTKLNNLLGLISLFITLPGYWLVTKNYGPIGSAYVFCIVQTGLTFIYLYFINKKFIICKKIGLLFITQIILPMLITTSIAFGFSFIPSWVSQNRTYVFAWIAIATFTTFVATILILIPKIDLKHLYNLISLNNTKFDNTI